MESILPLLVAAAVGGACFMAFILIAGGAGFLLWRRSKSDDEPEPEGRVAAAPKEQALPAPAPASPPVTKAPPAETSPAPKQQPAPAPVPPAAPKSAPPPAPVAAPKSAPPPVPPAAPKSAPPPPPDPDDGLADDEPTNPYLEPVSLLPAASSLPPLPAAPLMSEEIEDAPTALADDNDAPIRAWTQAAPFNPERPVTDAPSLPIAMRRSPTPPSSIQRPPSIDAPVPAEFAQAVRLSQRLGGLLYIKDLAAWRATDALAERIAQDERVLDGWVTVGHGDDWQVHFVGEIDGELMSLYRADFNMRRPKEVVVHPVSGLGSPEPLPPDAAQMFRARQLALASKAPRQTEQVNTVVLPIRLDSGPAWTVYLLATPSNEDEMVIGGHVAVLINYEGTEVLDIQPHSRTMLRVPLNTEAGETEFYAVSHTMTPWPLETHVFSSLSYRQSFSVVTQVGGWRVEGRRIRFMGSMEDAVG